MRHLMLRTKGRRNTVSYIAFALRWTPCYRCSHPYKMWYWWIGCLALMLAGIWGPPHLQSGSLQLRGRQGVAGSSAWGPVRGQGRGTTWRNRKNGNFEHFKIKVLVSLDESFRWSKIIWFAATLRCFLHFTQWSSSASGPLCEMPDIRTWVLCPRSLERYQWATTSHHKAKISWH